MRIVPFREPSAFYAATQAYLLADEARHNLILGLLGNLIRQPETYPHVGLWLVEEAGQPALAALVTHPHRLVLSRATSSEAIATFARALAADGPALPGVIAGLPDVETFAAAYADATGRALGERMEQGIYALGAVEPLDAPPGSCRPAEFGDLDRLVKWMQAFVEEALPAGETLSDAEARRRLRLRLEGEGHAGLRIWDDDGPVCFVGFGSPTPSGIRVGPVYTPPALRGRGYGTGLVAAVSAELLAQGRRFCFLYTDMANPTSNAIYQRIGYRLVCGSAMIPFE